MKYKINEIYYSLQGEGYWTGRPAVFIRLAGCNLSCSWCDTDHSQREELTVEELICRVNLIALHHKVVTKQLIWQRSIAPMIVWTGGEPTLQLKDNDPAFLAFKELKYFQAIETNGTNRVLLPFDWITISPKGSYDYMDVQLVGDECKIVLDGTIDPEEIRKLGGFMHYFIQPCCGGALKPINYVLEHPHWRLSLQCQKIIGIK